MASRSQSRRSSSAVAVGRAARAVATSAWLSAARSDSGT